MLTAQEVNDVISLVFADKPKAEQKRICSDALNFSSWLAQQGKEWPDSEDDYEGYRAERKRRVNKKPTQPYEAADKAVSRIKALYEAVTEQRKGDITMNEVKSNEVKDVEAIASEPVEQEMKSRRGRKQKPEAEKRSEKLSVYLTPRVYEGMRALAAVSMQDMSDIFFMLASDFVERNTDKLISAQNFLANLGDIK